MPADLSSMGRFACFMSLVAAGWGSKSLSIDRAEQDLTLSLRTESTRMNCQPSCSARTKRLFVLVSSSHGSDAIRRRNFVRKTWLLASCEPELCDYRFFVSGLEDPQQELNETDVLLFRHNSSSELELIIQQLDWLSKNAQSEFVLLVRDTGFVCLRRVVAELAVRPTERFAWTSGCLSLTNIIRAEFAILSLDVAQLLIRVRDADSAIDLDLLLSRVRLAKLNDGDRLVDPSSLPSNYDSFANPYDEICESIVHYVGASEHPELPGTASVDNINIDNATVIRLPSRPKNEKVLHRIRLPLQYCPVIRWSPNCTSSPYDERTRRLIDRLWQVGGSLDERPTKLHDAWEELESNNGVLGRSWREVDLNRYHDNCCATHPTVLAACSAFRGRSLLSEPFRSAGGTILASFPGSGNTWMRLLLEYSTGYLTGSIYNDDELMRPLPAEGNRQSKSVLAVKAHVLPKQYFAMTGATKVILLTREPLHAIWAEFNRRTGELHSAAARIAGVAVKDETNTHVHVVEQFGPSTRQLFARYALCMACKWSLYVLAHFEMRPELVHFVRYEDLQSDTDAVLRRAIEFIGLRLSPKRLRCAPHLAIDNSVQRNKSRHLSVATVFGADEKLACSVWNRVTANWASRAIRRVFRLSLTNGIILTSDRSPGQGIWIHPPFRLQSIASVPRMR